MEKAKGSTQKDVSAQGTSRSIFLVSKGHGHLAVEKMVGIWHPREFDAIARLLKNYWRKVGIKNARKS